jgi:hypothetical protein
VRGSLNRGDFRIVYINLFKGLDFTNPFLMKADIYNTVLDKNAKELQQVPAKVALARLHSPKACEYTH